MPPSLSPRHRVAGQSRLVQRPTRAPQPLAEHGCVDPHADAKVARHLEETSGHGGRPVPSTQALQERLDRPVFQPQKCGGAEARPQRRNFRALLQERRGQCQIGLHHRVRAVADGVQMLEGRHAEQLAGMHQVDCE